MREKIRTALRLVLAVGMIAVGVDHFAAPDFFVRIVPRAFPAPQLLVEISGVCEVLGGVGLLVPWTRRAAGIGLVMLYVAVFPANVNMVVHPGLGGSVPPWALWARLPLQLVFIAWAIWVSRPPRGDA
ncbi:MAG TPA: DoxX family membrane protein [Polyangiaceae bacterium]|nr:DoxX family membrane protein [Polyangiaceae bacterium]